MLRYRQRYLILALITVILAFSTGDRATLSIAGSGMAKELDLTPVQMGWLFSSFAWAYVLAHIPAGWLVDRLGAKRTVLLGVILWSICTALQGAAAWFGSVFATLLVLRFLMGVFEAPVGPASGRVIAMWFPSSERGMAGSIFNSAQYLSLAVFTPLMGWLDHKFGWEHVFSVMGGLGLLLSLLWYVGFHAPGTHPKVTKEELDIIQTGGALTDLNAGSTTQPDFTKPRIRDLFRSRMLCGIFLAQYCITAITWFFVSWFPAYLVQERHFSVLNAGFLASLPAIAGFVGGVSTGFVTDWLLKKTGSLTYARKLPITVGLLMTSTMIGCNYVQSDAMVIGLMAVAFFGKGFGSLGWTVVADTAPKSMIGVTGGVFNALGNSAGIVTPLVIGYILGQTGSFHGALIYVGAHGFVAVLSYWFIVGRIERFELPTDSASVHTRSHKELSNI